MWQRIKSELLVFGKREKKTRAEPKVAANKRPHQNCKMAAFHFDAPRQTVTNVKASEALIAETKASEASSDQKAAEAGRGRGSSSGG